MTTAAAASTAGGGDGGLGRGSPTSESSLPLLLGYLALAWYSIIWAVIFVGYGWLSVTPALTPASPPPSPPLPSAYVSLMDAGAIRTEGCPHHR